MASTSKEDNKSNEIEESDVEIVPFLGNVGETMSSSENSDEYEVPWKRKKISKFKTKKQNDGYCTNESSSSLEVLDIKFPVEYQVKDNDDQTFSENQLGDRKVIDFMFKDEMDLIDAERKNVCINECDNNFFSHFCLLTSMLIGKCGQIQSIEIAFRRVSNSEKTQS